MRRPRLTIGRLMALVGVLCLVLSASILGGRADYYRRQAKLCEMTADLRRVEIDLIKIERSRSGPVPDESKQVARLSEELAEAERDARRFRAAQRRPWLAVPEDAD